MKHLYFLTALVLIAASCSKVEVSTYNSDRYVQFDKIYTDTATYSFIFFPGQDEVLVPLEMKLTGRLLDEPAKINFVVNTEHTTATSAIFTLPDQLEFGAQKVKDIVYLPLKKAGIAEGDSKVYTIVLDIEDGRQLRVGETNYSRTVVRISNNFSKPDWWTTTVTNSLLGVYSDKKYITFIENVYSGDLTGASNGTIRVLAIQFKNFLKAQYPPIMDGDEEMLNTVPVIGS